MLTFPISESKCYNQSETRNEGISIALTIRSVDCYYELPVLVTYRLRSSFRFSMLTETTVGGGMYLAITMSERLSLRLWYTRCSSLSNPKNRVALLASEQIDKDPRAVARELPQDQTEKQRPRSTVAP